MGPERARNISEYNLSDFAWCGVSFSFSSAVLDFDEILEWFSIVFAFDSISAMTTKISGFVDISTLYSRDNRLLSKIRLFVPFDMIIEIRDELLMSSWKFLALDLTTTFDPFPFQRAIWRKCETNNSPNPRLLRLEQRTWRCRSNSEHSHTCSEQFNHLRNRGRNNIFHSLFGLFLFRFAFDSISWCFHSPTTGFGHHKRAQWDWKNRIRERTVSGFTGSRNRLIEIKM